jgi:CubicO group peptidase (beta-lactamase class C family)
VRRTLHFNCWKVLCVFLGMAAMPAIAEDKHPSKADRIDEVVRHYQNAGFLNGAVVVGEGGKIIYEKGVGDADFVSHTPNTPLTRFGIGSITKQFTAVLVLQQVAEGKIRLDAHASEYLPWYRKDIAERITIEQLLHHTSGLPRDFDAPEFGDGPAAGKFYEPTDFAKQFCSPNLATQPGTTWNYSNCGYILLGLILENVTGEPYGEFAKAAARPIGHEEYRTAS